MLFLFLGQNKSSAFCDQVQPSVLAHRRLTTKLCTSWSPYPIPWCRNFTLCFWAMAMPQW